MLSLSGRFLLGLSTDPIDGICAVSVLLWYRDGNNLIQPLKIMLLAMEKTELIKCEYYSIGKCFYQ